MERDFDILSKGVYRHSYISDFLYVKYYMFVRKNRKKYLSVQIENGSDAVFDSISFTVVALDMQGEVIERIPVTYSDITLRPKDSFTGEKMIRVSSECSDFKIIFDRAYSNDVLYSEQGGHVMTRYARKSALSLAQISAKKDSAPKPVRKKGFLMALAALAAVAIIVGADLAYIFGSISAETERRREEAAEKYEWEEQDEVNYLG